ncbi:hypothetical protein B0H17DRAFT_1220174 [Mycena rosella]|uniref:Uncharacterized protein n=1 Tax=Mycena rosella TaxID=1033263 RepID=A0AAD7BCU4_MYCRO|nr:hypothetical protein B0H17DRAFT_1220174 [Mycena rosella]
MTKINIYDFIHMEDEQRATPILDESLVMLDFSSPIAIDFDLGIELPHPPPIVCVAHAVKKERAIPSPSVVCAASISLWSSPSTGMHSPAEPRPGLTIRIPRAPPPVPAPTSMCTLVQPLRPGPSILATRPTTRIPRPQPPGPTLPAPTSARTANQIQKAKYHKRLWQHRGEAESLVDQPRKKKVSRRIQQSTLIFTLLDISGLRIISTAWLGCRILEPDLCVYSLPELCDSSLGMQLLAWDGWVCRPLIDCKNRLFTLLAGRPAPEGGKDTYQDAVDEVTSLFDKHSPEATGDGRWGTFHAVSVRTSFGGGQQRPGTLLNSKINASICSIMVMSWALCRIIGFSNSTHHAVV